MTPCLVNTSFTCRSLHRNLRRWKKIGFFFSDAFVRNGDRWPRPTKNIVYHNNEENATCFLLSAKVHFLRPFGLHCIIVDLIIKSRFRLPLFCECDRVVIIMSVGKADKTSRKTSATLSCEVFFCLLRAGGSIVAESAAAETFQSDSRCQRCALRWGRTGRSRANASLTFLTSLLGKRNWRKNPPREKARESLSLCLVGVTFANRRLFEAVSAAQIYRLRCRCRWESVEAFDFGLGFASPFAAFLLLIRRSSKKKERTTRLESSSTSNLRVQSEWSCYPVERSDSNILYSNCPLHQEIKWGGGRHFIEGLSSNEKVGVWLNSKVKSIHSPRFVRTESSRLAEKRLSLTGNCPFLPSSELSLLPTFDRRPFSRTQADFFQGKTWPTTARKH